MGIQQSKKCASFTQAPDIGIEEFSATTPDLIATDPFFDGDAVAPPLNDRAKKKGRKTVTFAPIEEKRRSRTKRPSHKKEPTLYPWDRAYDFCQQKQSNEATDPWMQMKTELK